MQRLLGSTLVSGLPRVGSSSSGVVTLGVSYGAGQPEAHPSTSPAAVASSDLHSIPSLSKTSASSIRKGKGKSQSTPVGKAKRSRKAKGRTVLRISEDIDDDDRREDDRIMQLINLGFNLEDVDRLYCHEGLSAGDVGRLLPSSSNPDL